MFSFTRNPLDRSSTLSWIGYDYPLSFLLWGFMTESALFLNLLYLYRRTGFSGRVGSIALYGGLFAAPPVVLFNDWGWEQTAHLAATAAFVLLNGTALIAYFMHRRRERARYWITAAAVIAVLAGSVAAHALIKQNGLTELVPIWTGLFLLLIVNFTGFYPDGERETPVFYGNKSRAVAVNLARFLGMLGACDFYLNRWSRGALHLLMTYTGALLCVCRFTGVGHWNHLQGEAAWIFLTAGISLLAGSLAWAVSDAVRLADGGMRLEWSAEETAASAAAR